MPGLNELTTKTHKKLHIFPLSDITLNAFIRFSFADKASLIVLTATDKTIASVSPIRNTQTCILYIEVSTNMKSPNGSFVRSDFFTNEHVRS